MHERSKEKGELLLRASNHQPRPITSPCMECSTARDAESTQRVEWQRQPEWRAPCAPGPASSGGNKLRERLVANGDERQLRCESSRSLYPSRVEEKSHQASKRASDRQTAGTDRPASGQVKSSHSGSKTPASHHPPLNTMSRIPQNTLRSFVRWSSTSAPRAGPQTRPKPIDDSTSALNCESRRHLDSDVRCRRKGKWGWRCMQTGQDGIARDACAESVEHEAGEQ